MRQITLFFAVQVLRRNSHVCILKVSQEDDEWNFKRRNDTTGENPNKISVKYIILNINS